MEHSTHRHSLSTRRALAHGVKVVEYDRLTPQFRQLVADSKYHVWPNFGELHDGYILLQDHGFPVSFRNIKIRELPRTQTK